MSSSSTRSSSDFPVVETLREQGTTALGEQDAEEVASPTVADAPEPVAPGAALDEGGVRGGEEETAGFRSRVVLAVEERFRVAGGPEVAEPLLFETKSWSGGRIEGRRPFRAGS